jgi:hypothetical protein
MPGFPDQFMPFGEAPRAARVAANTARVSWGPVIKRLRERAIRRKYDRV